MRQRRKKQPIIIPKKLFLGIGILFILVTTFTVGWRLFAMLTQSSKEDVYVPVVGNFSVEDLRQKLDQKNLSFEDLKVSTQEAAVIGKVKGGPTVIFSKSRALDWQVDSLQLIMTRLTIDKKDPVLVDLRYDKPIVKF